MRPHPREMVPFKFNKGQTRWAEIDATMPQIWVEEDDEVHDLTRERAEELEDLGRGKIVEPAVEDPEALAAAEAEVMNDEDEDAGEDKGEDADEDEDEDEDAGEDKGEDKRKPGLIDKLTKRKPGPTKKQEVKE